LLKNEQICGVKENFNKKKVAKRKIFSNYAPNLHSCIQKLTDIHTNQNNKSNNEEVYSGAHFGRRSPLWQHHSGQERTDAPFRHQCVAPLHRQ